MSAGPTGVEDEAAASTDEPGSSRLSKRRKKPQIYEHEPETRPPRWGKRSQHCPLCSDKAIFSDEEAMTKHFDDHLAEKVGGATNLKLELSAASQRDCRFCFSAFSTGGDLLDHLHQHLRLCTQRAKFLCRACRLRFMNIAEYFAHHRLHIRERMSETRCCECRLDFSHPSGLVFHRRFQHKEAAAGRKTYKCPTCGKLTRTEASLQCHLELHKSSLGIPEPSGRVASKMVCDTCGYETRRFRFFDNHLQTHLEVKKHGCGECGKTFSSHYLLRNHDARHHRRELPCLCEVCGKAFACHGEMRNHNRTAHCDYYTFKCSMCGAKLKSKRNARRHALIHCRADPYQCSHCGSTFANRGKADVHKRRGHDGAEFVVGPVSSPAHEEMIGEVMKPIPPEPIPQGAIRHRDVKSLKEARSMKYNRAEASTANCEAAANSDGSADDD